MAQHDYVIANGSGSAVRSDLNNALAAIVSQNSGATEPTDKFAYMWWADTSAGVLKLRNASNNAWITLRELDGTLTIEGGSASTPGLYFTGDANTGIYSPGADQFGITTNGTARVYVGSTGDVGIGTTSPGALLHTLQSSAGTAVVGSYLQNSSTNLNTEVRLALAANTQLVSNNRYAYISAINPVAGENGNELILATNPNGGAPAERVRIDSSGNLGIGTTTPDGVTHILKTSAGADADHLILANASSTADTTTSIYFAPNSVGKTRAAVIKGINSAGGGGGNPTDLAFFTNPDGGAPTEKVRIDSSGNLGIGTSSPNLPLHVERSTDGTQTLAYLLNTSIGGTNETADLALALKGTHGAAQCVISAGKEADISTAANADVFLAFSTTANDALAEAMRINSAGELLIGYTADNGAYKLQVNSQIFATSATVATSDGRYKENVATLGGCLDLVKALRPVSFTWKPQEDITRDEKLIREGHNFPDGTQVGFIAQEVQEVLADKPWLGSVIRENTRPAINDDAGNELAPEEQFLGIAESNLIAVLTNALQEAIAKIETLEAKVAALEAP